MKIDATLFRSNLARRIFLMFVVCALIPVLTLSVLAFNHVKKQLSDQSRRQLRQIAKAQGLSLYERLLFLETELQLLSSSFTLKVDLEPGNLFNERLRERFDALFVFQNGNPPRKLFGEHDEAPDFSAHILDHIRTGRTALVNAGVSNGRPRIIMARMMIPGSSSDGLLVGEINPDYLWGIKQGNLLPPNTECMVLDDVNRVLFSSFRHTEGIVTSVLEQLSHEVSGDLELTDGQHNYLAGFWRIYMKPGFAMAQWTVLLGESKSDVFAHMSDFQTIFTPVIFLAFGIVLLLSINYIRKSLIPLESLKKATRRIAMKDFDYRVNVKSRDEFQDLAAAFNDMSVQLRRQFKAQVVRAEIDRAILSSLHTDKIVKTALVRMHDYFSADVSSISLVQPESAHQAHTYWLKGSTDKRILEESVRFSPADSNDMQANPISCSGRMDLAQALAPAAFSRNGIQAVVSIPVIVKDNLAAIIFLGHRHRKVLTPEEITEVGRMADQVAVALTNANLIEELNRLNWGTLEALARTVDAKSSWTAGHSERVRDIALKIAEALRLDPSELETIHRAALLHDIGKLAVPAAILDTPVKLSDEEMQIIREHPRTGARILEPITAFADVIPIVLQHHERFDGQGYPHGLRGEAITLGARILAVADVYDALSADRPYRRGLSFEQAVAFLKQEAGHYFDPMVVECFTQTVMAEDAGAALTAYLPVQAPVDPIAKEIGDYSEYRTGGIQR